MMYNNEEQRTISVETITKILQGRIDLDSATSVGLTDIVSKHVADIKEFDLNWLIADAIEGAVHNAWELAKTDSDVLGSWEEYYYERL